MLKRPLIRPMVLGALAIGAAAGSKFLDVHNDLPLKGRPSRRNGRRSMPPWNGAPI